MSNTKIFNLSRCEAFVQGYVASLKDMRQSEFTDSELLEMLPVAEQAYDRLAKQRGWPTVWRRCGHDRRP